MYASFFGLQEEPFSIAPDPRFLYMSDKHREALALMHYGLTRGASFVLLTGEIGAGKTTVWRRFIEELPSNYDVASVVNPKLGVEALLARICDDLRVELPQSVGTVDLIDALHGHLLLAHAQGRRTLIAIDEAQALSLDVLEQLRLLTNLDSSGKKLQVMLIGQPELRQMLARPQLEPLAQRVVARYHLPALSESETAGYIAHRLAVAGLTGPLPFDGESLGLVHRLCRGVPRRINVLCDFAMAMAQAAGTRRVDRHFVESSAAEVFGARSGAPAPAPAPEEAPRRSNGLAYALVAGLALAGGIWVAPHFTGAPAPAAAAAAGPALAPTAVEAPAASAAAAPTAAATARHGPAVGLGAVVPGGVDALFAAGGGDEAAAWRALSARWGASIGAGEPCSAAAQQSLACYRGRGGLAVLRQIDRPALLRLVDDRGRTAHALLVGLAGDAALLAMPAGSERSVPLAQLARVWRGDFATFWRAPAGTRDSEAGPLLPTGWIEQQLARVDGQTPAPAGAQALRARVFAFQVAHGLTPDGVAGPLTLMQLNRAAGVDEPRLTADAARPA